MLVHHLGNNERESCRYALSDCMDGLFVDFEKVSIYEHLGQSVQG